MNPILEYRNKKGYNIFQSIQLLSDMDMYKDVNNIFKELKDIIPDKIHISTEGIEDEKTIFFLNYINGCSLELYNNYSVLFIKDNETLFEWNLKIDYFWIDYNNIWKVFQDKYNMNDQEIQVVVRDILEQYCKIKDVTLSLIGGMIKLEIGNTLRII